VLASPYRPRHARSILPKRLFVILDFGLAKLPPGGAGSIVELTRSGTHLGTPGYMSLEQARGDQADARSDLFSLGVTIYEMVTGRLPFQRETAVEAMHAVLKAEPVPPRQHVESIPPELERVILKALRKSPDERYQGAAQLAADLRALVPVIHAGTAEAAGAAARTLGMLNRHRAAAALAAVVVAATAAVSFFHGRRTPALTGRETISIADIDNKTGDEVFDGTLRQGLAVQLEQSPFLSILPEERVRETLQLMGRSRDERVTRDIAREICERRSIKAMIAGSISRLGTHYVLTLEATIARTGDVLARQQEEAPSKEQVLRALGTAATWMREKLGESLASIAQFDTPIEQATTPSLDALKAFSRARVALRSGDFAEAINLYRLAIDRDPEFALAYADLSLAYNNTRQAQRALQAGERAFALKHRASESERFEIAVRYYGAAGDSERVVEAAQQWSRSYPNQAKAHNMLALGYLRKGQPDRALDGFEQSLRVDPDWSPARNNLARTLARLNRIEEARTAIEQGVARQPNLTVYRETLYEVAFVQRDERAMAEQLEWARGKPDEYRLVGHQAAAAASFSGRFREAATLYAKAIGLARRQGASGWANDLTGQLAFAWAVAGKCGEARECLAELRDVADYPPPTPSGLIAAALCQTVGQAEALAEEFAKLYPGDDVVQGTWSPLSRAVIALRKGNAPGALSLLLKSGEADFSGASSFIRATAYLRARQAANAADEFRRLIGQRSPAAVRFHPLAHLGLARAAVVAGDPATARTAYQDFFALWKDADADLPVLNEARLEHERLK
jgi:tetratricopeptide (TPR) repeat protein